MVMRQVKVSTIFIWSIFDCILVTMSNTLFSIGGKKSGRQKRGGKGIVKTKKKAEVDRHIGLWRANRGKKKYVTIVSGLTTFEIDLKEASKFFAGKFACGSSVTGNEVVIQGDVKDDLFDIITEKWPEVDEDSIEDMGEKKI